MCVYYVYLLCIYKHTHTVYILKIFTCILCGFWTRLIVWQHYIIMTLNLVNMIGKLSFLSFYIWLINYSVCLLPYNGKKLTAPWPCGSFMFCNTDILLEWLLLKTFSAIISCFDPSALTVTQQTHQRPVCFDWPVCWMMEQRLARRWCFSVALTHKTKKRALIWCNIGSRARNDYKTCHGMSLQSLLRKAEQYDATEGEKERCLSVFIMR